MTIDWPNLIAGTFIGTAIGFLTATLFYRIAKRDADANHRDLVARLERLEEQGKVRLGKDDRGRIVTVEPIVVQPETPALTIRGQYPTLIGPDGTKR